MNRRRFLGAVATLVAAPLAAEAQQAGRVPRIGFLFFGSPGPSRELDAFRQGLRELGYTEGQNIVIEYRFASGRVERLPELATELARLKPDVLVTPGTPASLVAKQATSTIPIVFAGVADAVGAGLVDNLARPGRNITGLTSISAELGGKRLQLLKEVAPKASRVAVLYNPADRSNVLVLKELQKSAPALGLTLQPLEVRGPGEFDPQRSQARRPARRATDEVRSGDQPQHGSDSGPHDPAVGAGAGGSRDRVAGVFVRGRARPHTRALTSAST